MHCLIVSGTPLIIEQPYVTVLSKELDWDLEHCHYCYKRILGGIPCNICVFVSYYTIKINCNFIFTLTFALICVGYIL